MNQHYRKPGLRFAILSLWALLGVFPLWADSTLDVQCNDQGGTPLADVKVSVYNLNSQKMREKKSDAKGRANLNKLEDGVYRGAGWKRASNPRSTNSFSSRVRQQSVTLQFKPGEVQKQLYFESDGLHQKSIDLLKQGAASIEAAKFADAEKQLQESLEIYPGEPGHPLQHRDRVSSAGKVAGR